MIVAGLGSRQQANVDALYQFLQQVALKHDVHIDACAVLNDRLAWAQILAERYNLPVIGIEKSALKTVTTPTQSAYSLREKGVGSVAESLALLAAEGAKLLSCREVSADRLMTCALAYA